jgi:MFS family permease
MAADFRGWWVVAVAFLAQFASLGLSIIVYPLFAQPIQAEFSVSMLQFNLAFAPFTAVMTLAGPVVGPRLDRGSIRAVMTGGALLLSASLALMSLATSAWQLGALFGFGVALSVTLLGPLPATTVTAKWFARQRGRAIGIVSLGPLVAGVTLSILGGVLLASQGWRATLRWFSLGALLVAPLVWTVIRNRPEDIGQFPDGEPGGEDGHGSGAAPHWSTRALLASPSFWVIALAVGLIFGFLQAWQPNVAKYAEDLGHGLREQSWLPATAALMGLPATVALGWLAERIDPRTLILVSVAILMAAFAVLRAGPALPIVLAASAVMGASSGGLMPLYAALLARTFGPASFGTAMGLAGLVMLPFGVVAPLVIGQLRDQTGSYSASLALVIAAFGVGAMILGLLPRRQPRAEVAPVSTL